jgi:hypothetical protein
MRYLEGKCRLLREGFLSVTGCYSRIVRFVLVLKTMRTEVISRLQVLVLSSPKAKKILAEALHSLGKIVAMTGDGPTLRTAGVGVLWVSLALRSPKKLPTSSSSWSSASTSIPPVIPQCHAANCSIPHSNIILGQLNAKILLRSPDNDSRKKLRKSKK